MKKILFLLTICTLSFSSCEKDDICDENTATTPKLVITFYDKNDMTELKNVTQLKVIGEGMTNYYLFDAESEIKLPLKTTSESTKFSFQLNSNDESIANTDTIEFNYSTSDVYVSRACGFKTLFALTPASPFIHTDSGLSDGLWMHTITVETANIQTEDETHIKIYF
jgi:hypothetical protein